MIQAKKNDWRLPVGCARCLEREGRLNLGARTRTAASLGKRLAFSLRDKCWLEGHLRQGQCTRIRTPVRLTKHRSFGQ